MRMSKSEKKGLVPELRFPKFRDAGEWVNLPLSKFVMSLDAGVSVNSGDRPAKSKEAGILKTSAVTNGIFEPIENKVVYEENEIQRLKEPVCEDSIIISRMNTPALVGANAYVKASLKNLYLPDRLWAAKPKPDTSMRFIAFILGSGETRATLSELATGTSGTMKNITKADVLALQISAPTKGEQQKIADCLTSIDELVTAQTQKLDALKSHKKGLMQQLFPAEGETVPKRRFPEFRDEGEWSIRELSEFITERSQCPSESVPLFSLTIENGVTPKTERYERSFLVKNKDDAYKLVLPEDFAFNPMNLRFGAIGRHAGTESVAVSKYYNIFFCDKTVDARFCEVYFKSAGMVAFYDNMAIGSLIEKRRVHFSDFLKFKIRFPRLSEQQKIAYCLTSVDELIANQAKKIKSLKTHKKGLMQQLFPAMDEVDA